MANGGSGNADVFDVRKVRRLVELMKEHDLAEVDLKQADQRIRLRRGQEPSLTGPVPSPPSPNPPPAPSPVAVSPAPAATPAPSDATTAPVDDDANVVYITSPMVGTFYTSSSPDSPAFVNIGDSVTAESTVCILEAMKVFNEIPAECSGTIAARLAEDGDAIEFGQKLFKVRKA